MTRLFHKFNRPRPLAVFLFLSAFLTTMALGTWQVGRLEWKEGLIADINAAAQQPPITQLPHDAAALAGMQFTRIALSGTWLGDVEFHLTPRYFHGTFGYQIITPLKLADGRIILVIRGWVPAANKLPETRPETKVSGRATVMGMLRVGNERNPFTPDSQPERNVWFGRDVAEMAAFAGLKNVAPIMLDAVGTQDRTVLPIPSDGTIKLMNDHLSYIITWYGVAAGILVIFLLAHYKRTPK
jgi:surfeit locus 1 family protein